MPRNTPIEGLPPQHEDGSIDSPPPKPAPVDQGLTIPRPITPQEDPLSPDSGIK